MDLSRIQGKSPEIEAAIKDQYEYHEWTPEKVQAGVICRTALQNAAITIVEHVPPCPDRSAALRKLREARMDCNSAITHDGKY